MHACANGHAWEVADGSSPSETTLSCVCPQCGSPALLASEDALPPPPERLALKSGDTSSVQPLPTVPGYELLENLGPGGMGVVFKARQLMPPRIVALKMIKEGAFASLAVRSRFRREVEAVARLQHPNIVPIHEFGEHEGLPFFTMEYMEGGTLQQQLAGMPQAPMEAARMAEIFARAIHAAHLQGVIHRDLKPSNVLLSAGSLSECTPKVADFGLAKIVEGNTDLTPTQAVLGTVGYMPPEQASGKSSAIGPAADVYSLGAILYQMLTGRPPFQGDSTIEVLLQAVREDPVPPRRLNASVPLDVETICLACLEKDPAKRYATALELAEDLRRFQAHEPIKRRPVGAVGRLTRWSRRNPALAASGGLAILSLLIVTVLSVIFAVTQAQSNRALKRQLAENLLERGQTHAEKNEHDHALLAFAQGLQLLPPEETDLERVLRVNLSASLMRLHRLVELFPEPMAVHSVAFTKDGKSLVTSNEDGKARIRDLATGKVIELSHDGIVRTAILSPDDAMVITACADGFARIWDTRTGDLRFKLDHRTNGVARDVWTLAFSKDGQWLVTGADRIRMWNPHTGKKVYAFEHEDEPLSKAKAFRFTLSHDGQHLAVAHEAKVLIWRVPVDTKQLDKPTLLEPYPDADKELRKCTLEWLAFRDKDKAILTVCQLQRPKEFVARVWKWDTLEPEGPGLRVHEHLRMPQFAKDGKLILGATQDERVFQFDAHGKSHGPIMSGVQRATFDPSGQFIFGYGGKGHVLMWKATDGAQIGSPMSIAPGVEALAFSTDGSLVAAAGRRAVGLWKPKYPTDDFPNALPDKEITSVGFHPTGKTIFAAAFDKIRFFDVAAGNWLRQSLPVANNPTHFVLYSPDGELLIAFGGNDTTLGALWNLQPADPARRPFKQPCGWAAFHPDRKTLAGGRADRIFLWDLNAHQIIREWRDANEQIHKAVFLGNDRLATETIHGKIKIWNTSTRAVQYEMDNPTGSSSNLAVSGNLLAAGGEPAVHFWDWTTGKPSGPPLVLNDPPLAIAFAHDGRTLVVAGDAIQFWDIATRRQLGPSLAPGNKNVSLAISPDGQKLLSGGLGLNRGVRMFDVPMSVTVPSQHAVLWSQVVTGLEMDDRGSAVRIPAEEWRKRRDELKTRGVTLDP